MKQSFYQKQSCHRFQKAKSDFSSCQVGGKRRKLIPPQEIMNVWAHLSFRPNGQCYAHMGFPSHQPSCHRVGPSSSGASIMPCYDGQSCSSYYSHGHGGTSTFNRHSLQGWELADV